MGPPVGREPGDVDALEEDAALVRRIDAVDDVEQRGLAGAVGPDDGEQLAAVDLEADAVDGHQAAEALGHVLEDEEGHLSVLR